MPIHTLTLTTPSNLKLSKEAFKAERPGRCVLTTQISNKHSSSQTQTNKHTLTDAHGSEMQTGI